MHASCHCDESIWEIRVKTALMRFSTGCSEPSALARAEVRAGQSPRLARKVSDVLNRGPINADGYKQPISGAVPPDKLWRRTWGTGLKPVPHAAMGLGDLYGLQDFMGHRFETGATRAPGRSI